jgi:hypothetical protein
MRSTLTLIIVLATRLAHADSSEHPIAIAVNEPLAWSHGDAFSIGAYAALTQHQVVRASYSTWSQQWGAPFDQDILAGGYSSIAAAWMYFPRRPYDGLSLEAGGVVKWRDTFEQFDDFELDQQSFATTLVAASAMVGWSWLIYDHAFVSLQVGGSLGWEHGSQQEIGERMPLTTSEIHHLEFSKEAMLRFGFAFAVF